MDKQQFNSISENEAGLQRLQAKIVILEAENKENRKAKKALSESERKYRTIFENTGTATVLIDENTIMSMINTEFERLSGYSKEETEGKQTWTDFIYPEDLEMMIQFHKQRRISPETTPRHYKCRVFKKTGNTREVRTVMMTVDLIRGTKQSIASVRDISEQVRLEKKILEISERERRQIGHNLHDDLGQHLIGIEALSSLLKQRLKQQNNPEFPLANDISQLMGEAIKKTKALAKGLCPVDMDAMGLAAALAELQGYIKKYFNIECELKYNRQIKILDNTIATNLYHIVQEAVNNAQRHGSATHITITFDINKENIILSVKDNGKGFSGQKSEDGLGLMIMSFRASSIGATYKINSSKGEGTEIICTINQRYL